MEIKSDSKIEIMPWHSASPKELHNIHSAYDMIKYRKTKLITYGTSGNSSAYMSFEPGQEGFIRLQMGDKTAIVHKRQLEFLLRAA